MKPTLDITPRNSYRPLEKSRLKEQSEFDLIITQTKFDLKRMLEGSWAKAPIIFSGLLWYVTTLFTVSRLSIQSILPIDYWNTFKDSLSLFTAPREGAGGLLIGIGLAVIGSGLIADDNASKAHTIYATKISKRTYILSKILTMLAIVFISLFLWAFLLYFIVIYKTGPPLSGIIEHWYFLTNLVILFVVYSMTIGGIALFFSSITDRSLVAGVLILVIPLLIQFIGTLILYDVTGISLFLALGPYNTVLIVWDKLWGGTYKYAQYMPEAVFSMILYFSLGLWALFKASNDRK